MSLRPRLLPLLCAAALNPLSAVQAARPLSVDDAAVAEPATCQAEGWHEHQAGERRWVLAGACGLGNGFELGLELGRPQPDDPARLTLGPALKWVPAAGHLDTGVGALDFGLKLSSQHAQLRDDGLRTTGSSVLALASWAPSESTALHLNLGMVSDRGAGVRARAFGLAAAWTPAPEWLLFAEVQATSRGDVFGGTLQTVGARWWWVKDKVGLDVTVGRDLAGGGTRWTLGFGRYGVAL